MKKKYSLWQLTYLLLIRIAILAITANLMIPCINFVVDRICETEQKEAFFHAHYRSEQQIFIESILGMTDETGGE